MQQQGIVISLDLNAKIKKNGGGSYDGWQLIYKTPEGEVKTLAKPVQSLRFNAALKASLETLSPGDEFTVAGRRPAFC